MPNPVHKYIKYMICKKKSFVGNIFKQTGAHLFAHS